MMEINHKQYIKLPDVSGQKIRKKYYIASAVKHPAKADIPMMIWILKEFVDPGGKEIVTKKLLQEFDKTIEWCKCDD